MRSVKLYGPVKMKERLKEKRKERKEKDNATETKS